MNVPIPPSKAEWLKAQVAAGRFASLAEAVEAAVTRLQADEAIDDQWVKPLVDEALEVLDRGGGTPWRKGEALVRIKASRKPGG
jgi:Arc/MetJ-type ribon-helix-helix transcriptional regulator